MAGCFELGSQNSLLRVLAVNKAKRPVGDGADFVFKDFSTAANKSAKASNVADVSRSDSNLLP
jgi:hypothetical protein